MYASDGRCRRSTAESDRAEGVDVYGDRIRQRMDSMVDTRRIGLTDQFGEGEVQVVADVFVLLLLVHELVCKKAQRVNRDILNLPNPS